ncbi:MAG: VWA domain-containing protein [Mycobacteriaceae bacterium]|nr:VWA domain-containing protein [Mycobacteriaceae bacterium]
MTPPGVGLLSMSGFAHPWLFVLVLVPIAVLVLYLLAGRRGRRRLRRFAEPELMGSVARQPPARARHVPIVLLCAALVMLTVALAGPTHDVKVPRNRAVIMLVVDVSQSMRANDVAPNRLDAARQAGKTFAKQLTSGVNLGLISFAGSANVLVSPTPDHDATVTALDNLRPADSTATGAAIFAALDSIATVSSVLNAGQDTPAPARIVLLSDGKENKPENPDNPQGAYTAARAAKEHGVPVTTIAFGTPGGYVDINGDRVAVPVDDSMMKKIAELSGGKTYSASSVNELANSYLAVQEQVGYQLVPAPASAGWLRLAVLAATIAAVLAIVINRRAPA